MHVPETEELLVHLAASLAAASSHSTAYDEAATIKTAYNKVCAA